MKITAYHRCMALSFLSSPAVALIEARHRLEGPLSEFVATMVYVGRQSENDDCRRDIEAVRNSYVDLEKRSPLSQAMDKIRNRFAMFKQETWDSRSDDVGEAPTRRRPHLVDGEFQSDKYPTTPRGKVPLSVKDPTAQDLLWCYAQRRRSVDGEFSDDLETALRTAGYVPEAPMYATGPVGTLEGEAHPRDLGEERLTEIAEYELEHLHDASALRLNGRLVLAMIREILRLRAGVQQAEGEELTAGKSLDQRRQELLRPVSDEEWSKRRPAEMIRMRAALLRGDADRTEGAALPGRNTVSISYEANLKRHVAKLLDEEAGALERLEQLRT